MLPRFAVLLSALTLACPGGTGGTGDPTGATTDPSTTSTTSEPITDSTSLPAPTGTGPVLTTGGTTTTTDSDPDSCWGHAREPGLRCSYDWMPAQCDPWGQDCPAGHKCSAYSNDGDDSLDWLKCVPVFPDPDQVGEPCTIEGSAVSGIDSCDHGARCWHVDPGTGTGICVPLCTGSPDAPICPEGTTCASPQGLLILCLPPCDPLAADCPPDELCVPNPEGPHGFYCTPDHSNDAGQVFDPCQFPAACDPGLACLASSLADECAPMLVGCCLPFCDTAAPNTCPGTLQECLPWHEMGMAPPGLDNVGVCGIPHDEHL